MDSLLRHRWLAVISCLLYVGQVQCDCTGNGIGIEGGIYTLTKQLDEGSLLVYQCPPGYYPYPHLSRMCLHSGEWKPLPDGNLQQRCNLVECPSPIVLMNGEVYPPANKYFLGNETTYKCYSGYTLRGSFRRVCQDNGKWNGRTPICIADSGSENICPDPGIPPGARRAGNGYGVGDKMTYSCSEGMSLMGSKERICMENGQWTGREPACYYEHTFDTPAEVAHAFSGRIREVLTILQPTDDTQEGRNIRILKNGTLNIYIAMDVSPSIDEKYVDNAKQAVKLLVKKISSFTVTPNYDIVFFTSVIYKAVDILDFFDGTVSRNTIPDAIENFRVDQLTSGTNIARVFHHFLKQMMLLKMRVGDEAFEKHHHVIIVFTDGGFNEGGDPTPTVARIKKMVYGIDGQYTKSREEHLDIYTFAIGADIYDEVLMLLAVGTGGEHFFKLQDLQKLNETFDKMIDESEVRGLCGLHRSYATYDRDSARKMFPWYAEVIVQNEGVRKCFGSLVTSQFILTAAHCFRIRDKPEHVTVEIGDGKNTVRKVKNFILHDKFDIGARRQQGVQEFYDYDVALIQLEEEVVISDSVRPICIPCTKETNDALRLDEKATCRQQEELLLGDSTVRLSFLTRALSSGEELHRYYKYVTVDEVLVKDVHAKIGGNYRPDCIKHALEAPNINTHDVTIPVTENFLCTGGLYPTVDHIACKGDVGGAVFKNYDYRTIQVGVVSWGTKDICQSGGGLYNSDAISRDFHINLFKVVPFLKRILGNDYQDDFIPLQFLN